MISSLLLPVIRIKPDWNVKNYTSHKPFYMSFIRIKPDWNVKDSLMNVMEQTDALLE